jgi:hypothetical protein
MSITDWDNEYARLARAASQMRTSGLVSRSGDVQSLQQGLQRLEQQLSEYNLPQTQAQRRRRLIQHLRSQQPSGGYQPPQPTDAPLSQVTLAMQRQDDLIDDLAIGVGRLRNQTSAIGEEARMHVTLLGDMENNLDAAQDSLQEETRRAMRLREDSSVWRLQLIVAGLFILLVFLILMGLTP